MTADERVDVVIVGGGTAGCVVGARLSEATSRSVMLIEAGPDLRANTPAELRDGWKLVRDFDWGYGSEPDERGVVEKLRRGKLVGGTSWVTRFAVRGSPADYDGWEALGNPGWGFEHILPYLNRLESDADFGEQPWHGSDGPIPVDRYLHIDETDITAAAVAAMKSAGFPPVEDHNRPGSVGVGRIPMNTRDGRRVTTADAYLPLGRTTPNLTIRSEKHVADVVFDGIAATGVRLVDGSSIEAGWVILCAGTYGSAPILMRSGIGPSEHLRSFGIPVRVDLPGVGGNLADHPGTELELAYDGPGRETPILHSIATFHSDGASGDEAPDLMLWVTDPWGDPPVFSIETVLLKPRSRGSVRLRSAVATDPPRVEMPGLREPSDVQRLAEAYERAWDVANRSELRRICGEPPARIRTFEEIRERTRQDHYSYPHVVGTCSMGPSPEIGAVVDPSGRVHGTDGLSVIDASIIPEPLSGFSHIPTIMVAERLSEEVASRL